MATTTPTIEMPAMRPAATGTRKSKGRRSAMCGCGIIHPGPGDLGLPPTFTPEPTQLPPTPYTPRGVVGETGSGIGVVAGEQYVVKRGDTLAEIAADFGVTVEAIARANGIADIDVIEVGQVLVIPAP